MAYHRPLKDMTNSERALTYVAEGSVVGLGTGRAATAFVRALGERVRSGFQVRGIATSEATAKLARERGIEVVGIDDVGAIDVTVDGADEVDPQLDLIKGYGGALLREKIVAAASKLRIILVGSEKLVPVLGSRGRLPVEAVPFGHGVCARRLAELGCPANLRLSIGRPFLTDNGNMILDCVVGPIRDPAELDSMIRSIPGVVATGIFAGMADLVMVQEQDDVRILERKRTV
jgi:ribose 5-phosphate isomerase A